MNKITKGALAMVLAGSVTFSVINVLLTDDSSERLAVENALTIAGDQKQADVVSQSEETVKDQTPTTNEKDVQTELSHNISALQADTQPNKEQFTKTTATNSANTNTTTTTTTTPAATTKSETSIIAPKTTTTTIPAATGTNATSEIPTTTVAKTASETTTTTTTTATNHGQQVSQAVKEKVASHQDKKDNNGKKL